MPYRTGPEAGAPTRLVLCVACGRAVELWPKADDFRCPGCDRHQPALRPDAAAPLVTEAVTFQGSGYDQLVAFAQTLGITESCSQITVRSDGVPFEVTLDIDSGRARGVTIDALTSGFPTITFTRESRDERKAKASGQTREVQTGDAAFDETIYIDTDVADEDVHVVLASPAVRAAIVDLLGSFRAIHMLPSRVSLGGSPSPPECFDAASLGRWLRALRVVAGAPRPIAVKTVPRGIAERLAWAASIPIFPVGLPAFILSVAFVPPVLPFLGLAGAGIGVVIGLLAIAALRFVFRGRSSSHTDLMIARGLVFLGMPFVGAATAHWANALFDRSTERADTLVVAAVEWDEEDSDTEAVLRGGPADLGEIELRYEDDERAIRPGDTAVVWTKAGAFGFRWFTRDSVVTLRGTNRTVSE